MYVAEGKVAIPANVRHDSLDPNGIGSMLKTKINVNLGVSRDVRDYDVEMEKVSRAVASERKPLWICQVTEIPSRSENV
jgi:thiamine biosynthesis protein ThiC